MNWSACFENPIPVIPHAEWWRDIPLGQRVRVAARGPDRKYAGQEGVFRGFSKPQGYAVVVDDRGKRLHFHPESLEPVLLSNPRRARTRVSSAEKAARRIFEAATYLQGRPAEVKPAHEPPGLTSLGQERWLVTVKESRFGPHETFWVYNNHILGARRRLPPRTRDMYRGDPVLADIVDELDRALEIVGQVKPGRRRK